MENILERISAYLDDDNKEIEIDWDEYSDDDFDEDEDDSLDEKKWSGKVKTKWEPAKGLFSQSASKIADALASASENLKQAMSRLNFYINRAGENLSADRKSELEKVKPLLRKKFA
jgi:hypothetical protein